MAESQAEQQDPRAQLTNLQKRFDTLVEKRNELNDVAKQLRQERDLLHEGRREFKERMDKAKAERDRLNAEMKAAKAKRNEYQKQAKDLIGSRKGKAGEVAKSLPLQARQLEKQIRDLEHKQETQPHTIEEERELLKIVKAKQTELNEIKAKLDADREIKVDLSNLDEAIDELFKLADAEHARVQELHKEAQKWHDEFVAAVEESKVLTKEANDKHLAYVDARRRADENHKKAMELREDIGNIRGEQRAERDAARREIQDINKQARDAVADPKKIDEKADESLDSLKKGGKISFGF